MSENEEFDVSLLDELKPLDCFLENELEKRSTSDESIGHEEALELDFLEDFVHWLIKYFANSHQLHNTHFQVFYLEHSRIILDALHL